MARPALRFIFAGIISIVITFMLFLFMIYITENFNKYSSMDSELVFDLETTTLEHEARDKRIRVQPPPELEEELETPDLQGNL